jgi:hypothetical protein
MQTSVAAIFTATGYCSALKILSFLLLAEWPTETPVLLLLAFHSATCAAGALFSIPRIRYMLPGNIPAGMLVDIFGFGWATVMTGCALLIMVSLYVGQYSHQGKLFRPAKKTH